MESNSSRSSETGLLSRTTGIRASRKFFHLVSKSVAVSRDGEPQDDPLLDLEIFLRQTWNIWGVSALFNFQVDDEVQLKQYAKKLREEVACILTQEDVSYEAKVSVLDVQRPKETDHPVVKIEVHAQVRDKEKQTSVYQGYLLSWHSEPLDQAMDQHATRLPLLLCRGTANTMRAVHATLGRMFDCILLQLPATPEDLAWLLPIVLSPGGGQDTARDSDELRLEYTVPGLPNNETLSIKFLVKTIIELWNTVSEDNDKINAHEVAKFDDILHHQILEIYSLQLGLCTLYKLQLPSITIAESKMKVINVDAMNTVLRYLNEKALDALHMNPTQLSISK